MTAPSIGAKDLLVAAGVGTFGNISAAWPIFISKMLDNPDNFIMLSDTGGLAPWPKWHLNFPDISVLVRSSEYVTGYDKIVAIKNVLLSLPPQSLNGDYWSSVIQIGDVGFIGYDAADRPMFSTTFRVFLQSADVPGDHRDPL